MIRIIHDDFELTLKLEISVNYFNDVYKGTISFKKTNSKDWIIVNHRMMAKDFTLLNNTDIHNLTPQLIELVRSTYPHL